MWTVREPKKIEKAVKKLPPRIQEAYHLLIADLRNDGPVQTSWQNYSKLNTRKGSPEAHHCHLNGDKPCYVVIWLVKDEIVQVLEVCHVATHEKTDYKRILGRI